MRRAPAPVMVAAPAVSTEDVARLVERREARLVEAVSEPSPESPVETLVARREARVPGSGTSLVKNVPDAAVSPVDALLVRRAARTDAAPSSPAGDGTPPVDEVAPSLDALLSRRDTRPSATPHPEET